jgi:phosphoglycerate dehydrogenase-like enzyme
MAPGRLDDSPERASAPSRTDKPTLYLLDNFHPAVHEFCEENFNAYAPGHPEQANWRENAEFILVKGSYVTAEDIAACRKLRAIGKQGVGIDKIDQKACQARGIRIFNTPGLNARTVAELTLSLTMDVARQVSSIMARQAAGVVVQREKCNGMLLHGKSIGVIGMGHIGRAVAKLFHGAMESEVIAYDPFLPADAWQDIPHTRVNSLDDLLATADVVSVHMPLTPETVGLISYPQMKLMKNSAILINAARGGIVNEKDLERALAEKEIWGAGLDCHEQEPPTKERYGGLWDLGVVSTPHVGATTRETQALTGTAAAKFVLEFARSSA